MPSFLNIPQDHRLNQNKVTTAQAASTSNLLNNLLQTGEH